MVDRVEYNSQMVDIILVIQVIICNSPLMEQVNNF